MWVPFLGYRELGGRLQSGGFEGYRARKRAVTSPNEQGTRTDVSAVYAKNGLVAAFIGVMDDGDLIRS